MSSLNEARLQATAYRLAAQALANRIQRIARQNPSRIPGAVRALAQEETIEQIVSGEFGPGSEISWKKP